MTNKRKAKIIWDNNKVEWVLYLWIDDDWKFSKAWDVEHKGEDELDGTPIDFVSDSLICEIAHLQALDYTVSVHV